MIIKLPLILFLASVTPISVSAAVLIADETNLKSVFANVRSGDTIQVNGSFGPYWLQNRTFQPRVKLDATRAEFTDTLTIQNVIGLTVVGGKFGSKTMPMRSTRTVIISKSRNINFRDNTFFGNGLIAKGKASHGLIVRNSVDVQISLGTFRNFHTGLLVLSSVNIKLDRNLFFAMTSDGIDIADSHFVTAIGNRCQDTIVSEGAHPDCIQLWSVLGQPVQSDVVLTGNTAIGNTQGFTSFNAEDGGGLRISMLNNSVTTSYPQGIACYNCVDSVIEYNSLATLPGSKYQTLMNIIGGRNNIVKENRIADK